MKSTLRLTKQGIPDLNYYGPRLKPAAPVEGTPATILEEAASAGGDEVGKLAETAGDADVAPV